MPVNPQILDSLAVFASGYAKRMLEGAYDRAFESDLGRKALELPTGARYGAEAGLYALMAFADAKVKESSPLGRFFKEVAMDLPSEISKRLINGARHEISEQKASLESDRAVIEALRGLDDDSFARVAQWVRESIANGNRSSAVDAAAERLPLTSLVDDAPSATKEVHDPILDATREFGGWLKRVRQERKEKRRG